MLKRCVFSRYTKIIIKLAVLLVLINVINRCVVNEREFINNVFSKTNPNYYEQLSLYLCVIMYILIVLLLFFPIKMGKRLSRLFGIIGLLVFPLISFWLVESLYHDPNSFDMKTVVFNYFIYLCIYFLIYLITYRFRWAIIGGSVICFLLGVINYFVSRFRGIPICPWDIFSFRTAMSVAGDYKIELNLKLLSRLLCIIVICLFAFYIKEKNKRKSVRALVSAAIIISCAAIYSSYYNVSVWEQKGYVVDLWAQGAGSLKNGFFLNFVMNTQYLQVEKPNGYKVAEVEEILKDYQGEANEKYADITPNIIMIMNEAYADLSVVGEFETNIDYMSFVNSLSENTVKGNLFVSVFGGGTSNTEYEVLTGNSMAFLANGSIAYQQYISKEYETGCLVSALKAQNYSCYAMHPMRGSNWNRDNVYLSMGFEEFYDLESFGEDVTLVRNGFTSDLDTYEKIIELYKNKGNNPLFILDITVQNHGGYATQCGFEEPVEVLDMEGNYPETNEYLSLLKISDNAIAYLIDYFSQETEPTMIIMFGDHQPSVEEEFYEELYGKQLEDLNLQELQERYEVPFFIWTNYDIEETTIEAMSANYLAGTVLSYTGLKIPKYFAFQNAMYKKLPVINVNGYRDAAGRDYTYSEESEYENLLNQYKILHYNNSIDRNHTWYPMYSITQQP